MGSHTFDEMDQMFEQMDSMLERMHGRWHAGRVPAIRHNSAQPIISHNGFSSTGRTEDDASGDVAVDLHEADNGYVLYVDLPGFERDEIDLRFDEGTLVIKASHEVAEEDHVRSRRVFERLSLPNDVNEEEINAAYKNGVLEISLPLHEDRETGTRINID